MSIEVDRLTKIYKGQRAIDSLSFSVQRGEICGFLGPNGAGKTTTMKILTCFIDPTEGQASICGINVEENPMEVRRRIGYLPEHNPLYPTMYVKEYLYFVGRLFKLPNVKLRVEELIDKTGLVREQHKIIGTLSKGYKQRVGLAQCMLHDPEVLILDEPTSGLDPNQLIEIRHLIKSLGENKTVLFSSHIMQEVEAICDHIVIIDKGKLIEHDVKDNIILRNQPTASIVEVAYDQPVSMDWLHTLQGIDQVERIGESRYRITCTDSLKTRRAIYLGSQSQAAVLVEMSPIHHTMEGVFQQLTRQNNS